MLVRLLISASVLTFLAPTWNQRPDSPRKTEHFDRDPSWEGYNNHMTAAKPSIMKQDFGYSPTTNFAGKAKGEIGGAIQRASKPASYAAAEQFFSEKP